MPKSDPNQPVFEWSLPGNGAQSIPAKRVFGRRLVNAQIIADITPQKSLFSEVEGMPVITSAALKGGPGKSVITYGLVGALSLTGRKILAIDADPQASWTSGTLGTASEQIPIDQTVVQIYAGRDPMPEDIIRPSGIPGVDIVPGSWALNSWNFPDPHLAPLDTQGRMRAFINEVRGMYDCVAIDTAPNLYACCYGALAASDFCFIITQPMNHDVSSLSHVFEVIRQVQGGANPELVNLGIVLNRTKRSSVQTAFESMLRKNHGVGVFDTKIAESVHIQEALLALKPVTHYKPKCAASKQFKELADELLRKIVAHQDGLGDGGQEAEPVTEELSSEELSVMEEVGTDG